MESTRRIIKPRSHSARISFHSKNQSINYYKDNMPFNEYSLLERPKEKQIGSTHISNQSTKVSYNSPDSSETIENNLYGHILPSNTPRLRL